MTDRELIEMAARAAGIKHDGWIDSTRYHRGGLERIEGGGFAFKLWNPLGDDADAFKLMVALELNVFHAGGNAYAMPSDFELDNEQCVSYRDAGGSESATRRAIVRAAAEMGGNQ